MKNTTSFLLVGILVMSAAVTACDGDYSYVDDSPTVSLAPQNTLVEIQSVSFNETNNKFTLVALDGVDMGGNTAIYTYSKDQLRLKKADDGVTTLDLAQIILYVPEDVQISITDSPKGNTYFVPFAYGYNTPPYFYYGYGYGSTNVFVYNSTRRTYVTPSNTVAVRQPSRPVRTIRQQASSSRAVQTRRQRIRDTAPSPSTRRSVTTTRSPRAQSTPTIRSTPTRTERVRTETTRRSTVRRTDTGTSRMRSRSSSSSSSSSRSRSRK